MLGTAHGPFHPVQDEITAPKWRLAECLANIASADVPEYPQESATQDSLLRSMKAAKYARGQQDYIVQALGRNRAAIHMRACLRVCPTTALHA